MNTSSLIADASSPGLCFKYVPDLALQDKFTVPNFIERYLIRNLAASRFPAIDRLNELRSSWGVICSSSTGHCLSHLVACIDLAIQGGGRPIAIFESGYYEGIAIKGGGMIFHSGNEKIQTSTKEAFVEDIRLMGTHHLALTELAQLLDLDVEKDTEEGKPLSTMWNLREYCRDQELDSDDRSKITNTARSLRFPAVHWKITGESLSYMFDRLLPGFSGSRTHDPISAEAIFSDDDILVVLSCFGTKCPSFQIPNGSRFPVDSMSPPDPTSILELDAKRGRKAPRGAEAWTVTIQRVSLDTAVTDLKVTIQERSIRTIPPMEARALGCFTMQGGLLRETWPKLALLCGVKKSSAKRGRDEFDSGGTQGGGSDPKKGKGKEGRAVSSRVLGF